MKPLTAPSPVNSPCPERRGRVTSAILDVSVALGNGLSDDGALVRLNRGRRPTPSPTTRLKPVHHRIGGPTVGTGPVPAAYPL
jgi:hypothetical protein